MLHRPHAATSVLVATLFTGCQAPPRPLVLRDTFPVTYEGHIAPAQPLPAGLTPSCGETAAEELAPSCSSDAALTVRATFVELPVDEVRALLPEWPPQGPRIQGAHLAKDELARHIADWRTRGAIASQPLLVVGFGQDATVRHTKRTAFVSRLELKGSADAFLVDPEVGLFEEGVELQIGPRRQGGTTSLTFAWHNRDRVLPRPIGQVHEGRMGSIELPILLDQRVHGAADLVPGCSLLLGGIVGSEEGTVVLLCVETDEGQTAVAAAAR